MATVKIEKIAHSIDVQKRVKFDLRNEVIEYLLYFFKVFSVVALAFIMIKSNLFASFTVSGSSMHPNYQDSDIVYVNKLTPHFGEYQRGDTVVIKRPSQDCDGLEKCFFIKRVIALPGETVSLENGYIYISNRFFPDGFRLDESGYLSEEIKTFKNRSNPTGIEEINEGTLGKNQYYLLGDNRGASKDSRDLGFIDKSDIEGRVFYHGEVGFTEIPIYR